MLRQAIIQLLFFVCCAMSCTMLFAQTLGGSSAFSFLRLSNTPQLSALGGVNTSSITNDAGMAFNNPALLRPEMNQQLHVSFNAMYADVKNYHSLYAFHYAEWETTFAAGVHFLDYGSLLQTDASGNMLGSFHPTDYVVQLSASRKYMEKWYYGATLKFINSNYGLYRSNAVAIDVGIAWYDSARLLQVSLLLKNAGTQLKKYMDSKADDLPFDLQVGVTKRLANAPIQFSLTAHHLHQFNIRYDDTTFNNDNGLAQNSAKGFTVDKLFRHFVFSAQAFITDKLELTTGYNYLLRKELAIANSTNGFTGFSIGVGLLFRKIHIRYARSHYQNNTGYNQFGLTIPFREY